MNIFNHLIPDSAILGIGPLMFEPHPDHSSFMLYGTSRYFFDIHLSAHTTAVKSEWFAPRNNKEEEEKTKQWKKQYFQVRRRIAEMMNEHEVDDVRSQHIDEVGKTYESIKDILGGLLADLQMPDENRKSIVVSPRIERVFEDIVHLRNLACK